MLVDKAQVLIFVAIGWESSVKFLKHSKFKGKGTCVYRIIGQTYG